MHAVAALAKPLTRISLLPPPPASEPQVQEGQEEGGERGGGGGGGGGGDAETEVLDAELWAHMDALDAAQSTKVSM
jgi:hypothetical protein